ncbi:MAG: general secretion pathway protein E, partial [Parcubacteria group bacterium Greene0416_79]
LLLLITPRLVRTLLESRERYHLTKAGIATLAKSVDLERVRAALEAERIVPAGMTLEKLPFYRPRPAEGAPDGFSGRIGIHEVLRVTPTIRDQIIKGATSGEIEAQARKEGMQTMLEDGIFKCVQGITTIEEVLRVVSE